MLETMLHHLEVGYMGNANPYHNNLHACDVLQTTHYFISQTGLSVKNLYYKSITASNYIYIYIIKYLLTYYASPSFKYVINLTFLELDVRFRNLYLIDCGHYSRLWPYWNNKQFSYQFWKWIGIIVQWQGSVGKSPCICFLQVK